MERADVLELYYITPITNLPSIIAHGIVSHTAAARLPHVSVANEDVQSRRAQKVVPGGRRLHDYVNLYICARNPMLYLVRHRDVCVVSVCPSVLDREGVVITDRNASVGYARFAPSPSGLEIVDREGVPPV